MDGAGRGCAWGGYRRASISKAHGECAGLKLALDEFGALRLPRSVVLCVVLSRPMGADIQKILDAMERSSSNVRFSDLRKVCDHFFERRPSSGGDHETYKTPWVGDPRVNIQNRRGMAKPYQVKQVLAAVKKLEGQE